MAINFNELPTSSPSNLPPKGSYFAEITSAEMKPPKDTSKPDYLNITFAISDKEGKSFGKVFDIISESDSDIIRYKIQRFITALNIPITGAFELKDLPKIIINKKLIVDITEQQDKEKKYPAKAAVDVFEGQIFYPLSDAEAIFGKDTIPAIDAADAADTTPEGDTIY